MGCVTKVLNLTTGHRIKRSQARDRVDQCISMWVDEGYSIRNLTLQETVAARSRQARDRDPLPYAELHTLRFEAPAGADSRASRLLAYEANLYAKEVTT